MVFAIIALIIIVVIIVSLLSSSPEQRLKELEHIKRQNNRDKRQSDRIKCIIEEATNAVFTSDKKKVVALYEQERLVKINNTNSFKFEELLWVELRVDDEIISQKSTANTMGRALVGGLLAGGAGAIVGGVTGKSKQKKQINKVDIIIGLSNLSNPVITYNCYKRYDGTVAEQQLEYAKKATDLLSVVIDKVSRESKNAPVAQNENKTDVSEELLKMKNLLDQGILSQEEFDAVKKKLLNL